MKREARLFLGTQKAQKSQIRRSQLYEARSEAFSWHAESAELYEAQCDAKFESGRLLRFLRILREVLSYLTPVKRLGKQFLVMLTEHPILGLDKLRVVSQ